MQAIAGVLLQDVAQFKNAAHMVGLGRGVVLDMGNILDRRSDVGYAEIKPLAIKFLLTEDLAGLVQHKFIIPPHAGIAGNVAVKHFGMMEEDIYGGQSA